MVECFSVKFNTNCDTTSKMESNNAANTDNDSVRIYATNFVKVIKILAHNDNSNAIRRKDHHLLLLCPELFSNSLPIKEGEII